MAPCKALPRRFLFLDKGAQAGGGASTLTGTATVLSPSKKNQTTHVNKCSKTNINITKDIHRKNSFHFMKYVMPQLGQNIFLQNLRSKTSNSIPSHLSFISLHNSFDILQQAVSLSLSLSNFLNVGGFAFNSNPCGYTTAIARSLRLK
jgi:hypothetical protein